MKLHSVKLTMDQLSLHGIHIGHNNVWTLKGSLKPFLIGCRNSINIINLYYTGLQLKTFLLYLLNISVLRHNILIVKHTKIFDLKSLFFDIENAIYLDEPWVGGFLTNFKKVKATRPKNILEHKFFKFKRMPAGIVLYDSSYNKWALFEALNLELPVFSVLDTGSLYLKLVNYPIIGNNKSFDSLHFYSYLIRNALLQGQQKERLTTLQLI